jgi:hydrogenase-4 component B
MNAIQLLLLSVAIFGMGALVSLLFSGIKSIARVSSGLIGALASIVGVIAAIQALGAVPTPPNMAGQLPFGNFSLQMDGLSALMVGIISIVNLAASIYSISYLGHYPDRDLGLMGFFSNLFVAMMLLVVTVSNAFYFLIFWEMMTLASYFLVIFESEKKESIKAGYLYMLVAHAGTALIMLSFFIFYITTGSFDFTAFRQAQLSPVLRDLVFLFGFIGFGAKAGVVPLHIWLPRAHPAAPSHISALLSGVMIKTAIYGILRVCVDFLGPSVLWWGIVVLCFGALSGILGVLFALSEHDVKRVLAYSSVENIGIILLGIGTGMVGLAVNQPVIVVLGFLSALYHTVNHAIFKSLLFLGAGSLDYAVHTRNLNQMGGLGKLMPLSGLSFLVGALAMSAIPPLNGFVSEWFMYQTFFVASGGQNIILRAALPLCAMLLALTGALAMMVAIKTYSCAFSGPARTKQATQANESPATMTGSLVFLAIGCILLGVCAPLVVPVFSNIVTNLLNVPAFAIVQHGWFFSVDLNQTYLSTPLLSISLLSLLVVPAVLVYVYKGYKSERRVVKDPWACGYGYTSRMAVTSNSFDQPVAATFGRLYTIRSRIIKPSSAISLWSGRARDEFTRMEPVIENVIRQPVTNAVEYLSRQIQTMQMGDVRMYCFYIILTLAVLLIVIFR